jgi:hypothetical protein
MKMGERIARDRVDVERDSMRRVLACSLRCLAEDLWMQTLVSRSAPDTTRETHVLP